MNKNLSKLWKMVRERKSSVFLLRETGMSGHFVGRIKGDKYRFELRFLKWDFS